MSIALLNCSCPSTYTTACRVLLTDLHDIRTNPRRHDVASLMAAGAEILSCMTTLQNSVLVCFYVWRLVGPKPYRHNLCAFYSKGTWHVLQPLARLSVQHLLCKRAHSKEHAIWQRACRHQSRAAVFCVTMPACSCRPRPPSFCCAP